MAEIPLTRGYVAIVDEGDTPLVNQYKWRAINGRSTMYAAAKGYPRVILMHRLIMQTPSNLVPDHLDGNGLNNRRNNLRNVTPTENLQRKPNHIPKYGFRGVSVFRSNWKAEIKVNNVSIYIGCYSTREEAAEAYNRRARTEFGEFALLNDVPSGIEPIRRLKRGPPKGYHVHHSA